MYGAIEHSSVGIPLNLDTCLDLIPPLNEVGHIYSYIFTYIQILDTYLSFNAAQCNGVNPSKVTMVTLTECCKVYIYSYNYIIAQF